MWLQLTALLLPVAATTGWLFGRNERRSKIVRPQTAAQWHHDYFIGLNYLINEQPDKAIDIFIKLLEVDTDTVETHLALGSLFRRRGEVDRAIRIHQNLIARPQLDRHHRIQALSELGQDYLRAGVLDRAERLFLEVLSLSAQDKTSLQFLLHIYQQEKDWAKAIGVADKLESISKTAMSPVIAHYNCELAEFSVQNGEFNEAKNYLKKALSISPNCVRASLLFGQLELNLGLPKEALKHFQRVEFQDVSYISEIVAPVMQCYQQLEQEQKGIDYLQSLLTKHTPIAIVIAIANFYQKKSGLKTAIDFMTEQIKLKPSLRGLSYLVGLYCNNSHGDTKEKLLMLQNYMILLLSDKPVYRCMQCGFSAKTIFWLCPSCLHWASVKPIQGLEGN